MLFVIMFGVLPNIILCVLFLYLLLVRFASEKQDRNGL